MSQIQDVAGLSAMGAARDDEAEARKALWGSALGYAMDGFDLLILGFMLRAISADLHLTATQAASLVTATLVGAVLGGFVFGILSDRLGRVRVLTWTIVLFAVFTGLCAMAQGYWDLLIYRAIAGIGLGGEFGIGMALVAEAWPASKRARVSSYVGLGWQSGVLVAAIVTPLLLPVIGWRGMFAIGIFPAIAAYFIRLKLHEPEIFIANKARDRSAVFSLRSLVADTETTKISLGMVILCSVQNFGYYGIMIWLPNYLSTRFGYGLTQSAVWTAVTIARHGAGHLPVRWLRGPVRPPSRVLQLHARRGHHGRGLFPAGRSDSPVDRGRRDGLLRQRHAGRLRRADERTLSDIGAGHGAERVLQHRPGGGRLWSAGGRGGERSPTVSRPRSPCCRCFISSISQRFSCWCRSAGGPNSPEWRLQGPESSLYNVARGQ